MTYQQQIFYSLTSFSKSHGALCLKIFQLSIDYPPPLVICSWQANCNTTAAPAAVQCFPQLKVRAVQKTKDWKIASQLKFSLTINVRRQRLTPRITKTQHDAYVRTWLNITRRNATRRDVTLAHAIEHQHCGIATVVDDDAASRAPPPLAKCHTECSAYNGKSLSVKCKAIALCCTSISWCGAVCGGICACNASNDKSAARLTLC